MYGLLPHLVLAMLIGSTGLQKPGESPVAQFELNWERYPADRANAVFGLRGDTEPAVFGALYSKLDEKGLGSDVLWAVEYILSCFQAAEQRGQVVDKLAAEASEPKQLILLDAVRRGRWALAGEKLARLLAHRSPEIRWRALAPIASASPEVAASIGELCADSNWMVRLEALDALARLHSPLCVAKATVALGDSSRAVRQSAIRALGAARDDQAIDPLIQCLRTERGVLVTELASALRRVTGKDLGVEPAAWESWRAGKELPPNEHPNDWITASFFGVSSASRRVVFVIDCSESMECVVDNPARFESLNPHDRTRMEVAKAALRHAVDKLGPDVHFNLIAFESQVHPWKEGLQQALPEAKSNASAWIEALRPVADERELGGLMPADAKGMTNTFGALKLALGPVAPADGASGDKADTIFLLTDGRPTRGEFVDTKDVLTEIRLLNETRRVAIHTLALGLFDRDYLRNLAEQNGPGTFIDLGE